MLERAGKQAQSKWEVVPATWPLRGLLFIAFSFGIGLRITSLAKGGLFQDDAWVALTGTVPFSKALHMAGTAPGFVGLLHAWLPLNSTSATWAALPALLFGVVGIFLAFPTFRLLGLSERSAAVGAVLFAISPVAIATSGHVKQYSLDASLSFLLLGGFVVARKRHGRWLVALGVVSVAGLWCSASVVPVVAAVWLLLLSDAVLSPDVRRQLVIAAGATGGALVLLFVACYSNLPIALRRFWADHLLSPSPWSTLPHRIDTVVRGLTVGLIPTSTALPHEVLLVTFLLGALVLLSLSRLRSRPGVALAWTVLGMAILAAVLGGIPLGTGRTDMAIYPALILLVVAGGEVVIDQVARRTPSFLLASQVLVAILLVVGLTTAVSERRPYPSTPIRKALVVAKGCVDVHQLPAVVVIDAYSRYPYALTTPRTIEEKFSRQYGAGFTVVSTTSTFILPAQPYERPYTPQLWAHHVAAFTLGTGAINARRGTAVAYVQTPPDGIGNVDDFARALEREHFALTSSATVGPLVIGCYEAD